MPYYRVLLPDGNFVDFINIQEAEQHRNTFGGSIAYIDPNEIGYTNSSNPDLYRERRTQAQALEEMRQEQLDIYRRMNNYSIPITQAGISEQLQFDPGDVRHRRPTDSGRFNTNRLANPKHEWIRIEVPRGHLESLVWWANKGMIKMLHLLEVYKDDVKFDTKTKQFVLKEK